MLYLKIALTDSFDTNPVSFVQLTDFALQWFFLFLCNDAARELYGKTCHRTFFKKHTDKRVTVLIFRNKYKDSTVCHHMHKLNFRVMLCLRT